MRKVTWVVSKTNSQLSFKLKYFEFSHIAGQILDVSGEVITNEFFDRPEIYLFLDGNSLETHQPRHNELLRSRDILFVERFPFIEFSSVDGCLLKNGRIWELTGEMRIKDIKKSLTLVVNFAEITMNKKEGLAKFRLFGEFSRSEFGLHCGGENLYGDAISISADLVLEAKIE